MKDLLINFLIFAIVFAAVWWGFGLLALPAIFLTLLTILGVIGCVYFLIQAIRLFA